MTMKVSTPPNHAETRPSGSGGHGAVSNSHTTEVLRYSQHDRSVVDMTSPVERVREVIAASGLSQGAFAEAVGLDASKLSKSLSGVRGFSSLDYARIAEFCDVTVDWLLTGQETQFEVAARAAAGRAPADALAEAERIMELRWIAGKLDRPQPLDSFVLREREARRLGRLDAANVTRTTRDLQRARWGAVNEGAALAARATAHITARGRSAADQDLAGLIEEAFGIDVVITPLGDGFDGLSATTDGVAVIFAAPTAIWARQRFTIAHELGHILADDRQDLHLDPVIDDAAIGADPTEARANAFAAAFLMPEAQLRARVRRGFGKVDFAALAIELGVSPRALGIRLEQFRMIDKMARDEWGSMSMKDAARIADKSAEVAARGAASAAPRSPGLLGRDLLSAYMDGRTTLLPYAGLLGVDADELYDSFESSSDEG